MTTQIQREQTRPDTAVRANPARDTWNVLTRELKPVVRDPFTLIFSLVQPLVFLGLFAPLLIGSSGQPVGETLQWFVPGVLVMIVLFGTGATGSNLQYEMMTGSHERTLVAPLSRSSLLVGRALKEIAPIVVQALIIVLIAWPFGFTINVPGLVIGLALLAVFGVGLGVAVVHARAEDEGSRVAVLGRAADADLPAADPVGHAAAARRGPGVDARGRRRSTR